MKIKNYVLIFLATIIYSAGISLFFDANNLAPGGVTGIAIILNRVIHVETGTLIFLLNIPILILGAWKFGFKFIISTLYTIALASVFTNIWTRFTPPTDDPLIAAIAGGCLVAVGIGVVFRNHATTGGIDIIIKMLRKKYPHLKTSTLYFIIDAMVIAASGILFRDFEIAMYAAIGVFVSTTIMDLILYGKDEAALLLVISEKNDQIAKQIMLDVESGVTLLNGKGAYSGKQKWVLMCVVKKHKRNKVELIVKDIDEKAFLIISGASEIFGEGYKSYYEERL